MKPTDITPYVWNRILQTFDGETGLATAWLSRQTDVSDIWNYLLTYEGIIGYSFYLHQLHQHLFHPSEIQQ
jgi:hypothetical protein